MLGGIFLHSDDLFQQHKLSNRMSGNVSMNIKMYTVDSEKGFDNLPILSDMIANLREPRCVTRS